MDNKKIVWLASYPKSGNTWFRAFLTALLNDGEVDINDMKTDGIFSSRSIFDNCTDLDSRYLYDQEAKIIQPAVFNHLAWLQNKDRLFIKIHDAYTCNDLKEPIVPTESTLCAIYIIRNPLDIVPSLANHINKPLEKAIELINNPQGGLAKQENNFNTNEQFRQIMFSWQNHVESWTTNIPFPVLVIRYEDMQKEPIKTFSDAIRFIGLNKYNITDIKTAIEAVSFNKLQTQESTKSFKERLNSNPNSTFFRKGAIDTWKEELDSDQINSIMNIHKGMMCRYAYYI